MSSKTLVVILGPTASGKTSLSLRLASQFMSEIISSDSRQFFRGMNIGTAKPSEKELNSVPHHFVDTLDVNDEYNVGMFEKDALTLLGKLFKKHPLVFMCGGSGLYINAVCNGFDALPTADPEVREKLEGILEREGVRGLAELLKKLDPDWHTKADLSNPHRLIRAIEVCMITGKPYSSFRKGKKVVRDFNIIKIGLDLDRELLYERINKRVDSMMLEGLLKEAKNFFHQRELNSLQTVGYQELFAYLEGKHKLEEAIELIRRNTRRYAKRQLTWFRKDKDIRWFRPEDEEEIIQTIRKECSVY